MFFVFFQTKFLAHQTKSLDSVINQFEGIYKESKKVKDSNAQTNQSMKKIWLKIRHVSTLGRIAFLLDFTRHHLEVMSKYYQQTSHLPWEHIRFHAKSLEIWPEMIKDLELPSDDFNTVYSKFPTLKKIAQEIKCDSEIVFKNCKLEPSTRENTVTNNPFYPYHNQWVKFIKSWITEIETAQKDMSESYPEHKMITDSICPVTIISKIKNVISSKSGYLNYLRFGDDTLERLCKYINKPWMNVNIILKEFNLFKKRAYTMIDNGYLLASYNVTKKIIKRAWKEEYEFIKLFDTDPKLYQGIENFWHLFNFFYVQGLSETDCESQFSTIKYTASHRPNLTIQRLSHITKIQKNGPKCGDEDEFLFKVSKKCLKQFNAPLAIQSKYKISRSLESKLNEISPLDFRSLQS